jgi:NADPH-dependent glutamate synthase beta subunit-like oxidoreductase
MLTKGIPNFRLEKDVVNAEIDVLRELGVEFRCGVEVGRDVTIQHLREQGYKAFYVAIGLQAGLKLNVPGEELAGVQSGIDFLRAVNRGDVAAVDGDTVVIGGGNAAIDVARTVTRLGNGSVNMYCLESDAEMPTVPDEKNEALAEGVIINNCWGPKRILGEDGKVTGVEFMRCLSVRDENGKFAPKYDENDTITVKCSNVLVSIGQRSVWGHLLDGLKAEGVDGRLVKVDPVTYQTAEPDVFAGGDIATGPRYTIDAIATGREGAVSIHRFVHEGQDLTICRNLREFKMLDRDDVVVPVEKLHAPARQEIVHDESKTKTMNDNRVPLTAEQVRLEASRCLSARWLTRTSALAAASAPRAAASTPSTSSASTPSSRTI